MNPPLVPIKPSEILSKKLLVLIMKTVLKNPEVEYISLMIDIVNLVIPDPEQRRLILDTVLKEEDPATTLIDDEAGPFNYRRMMRNIETQIEVRAIKHLHKRMTRQVKELDMWDQASKNLVKVLPSKKATSAAVKK
jgi:translation initiation factor 1 (eIF-1/SUI1)